MFVYIAISTNNLLQNIYGRLIGYKLVFGYYFSKFTDHLIVYA